MKWTYTHTHIVAHISNENIEINENKIFATETQSTVEPPTMTKRESEQWDNRCAWKGRRSRKCAHQLSAKFDKKKLFVSILSYQHSLSGNRNNNNNSIDFASSNHLRSTAASILRYFFSFHFFIPRTTHSLLFEIVKQILYFQIFLLV